eukprot:scaffold6890_cov68-Skeletonema_dohrnii-CCMP3373.AAC.3
MIRVMVSLAYDERLGRAILHSPAFDERLGRWASRSSVNCIAISSRDETILISRSWFDSI